MLCLTSLKICRVIVSLASSCWPHVVPGSLGQRREMTMRFFVAVGPAEFLGTLTLGKRDGVMKVVRLYVRCVRYFPRALV